MTFSPETLLPNEALAREVASSVIQHSANGRIPEELLPLVHGLMSEAAHEYGEIMNTLLELNQLDQPDDFSAGYSSGYADGAKDSAKILSK